MSEEEKALRQSIADDQAAMTANNEKIQANLGIIADPDATDEDKAAAQAENEALSAENLALAQRVTENTQTLTALVAQRTKDQLKQGVDEMEKTIKDIEDFLNDPKRFDSLGSQISDGVESALDGVLLMTEGNVQLKLALQQIEQGEEQLGPDPQAGAGAAGSGRHAVRLHGGAAADGAGFLHARRVHRR